jgi:predicted PurR-regulated permease PerM
LQKKVKYRWLSALLVLLALAIIGVGICIVFIPMIIDQAVNLGRLMQKLASDNEWKESIIGLMEHLPDNFYEKIQPIWEDRDFSLLLAELQNLDIMKIEHSVFEKLLPGAMGVFSGVGRVLAWFFAAFMVTLCLIFVLLDFENLKKKLAAQIPRKHSEKVMHFFISFDSIMGKYFRTQTIIAAIVGMLFAISFSIMGLPMGLPFGLFIGALNMVPYLQVASIPIAAFLGLVYSLETGLAFWQAVLIITAIYAGVQILQDMVIVPKLMGGALGMPPIAILLSLAVWGKLLGFLGFVLAIPFTCVIFATYKSYRFGNEKEANSR